MKDIKLKYSLIALSYLFLVFLIIISYVSIIPEENVPVLENTELLIKEEKDSFMNNENTVYVHIRAICARQPSTLLVRSRLSYAACSI